MAIRNKLEKRTLNLPSSSSVSSLLFSARPRGLAEMLEERKKEKKDDATAQFFSNLSSFSIAFNHFLLLPFPSPVNELLITITLPPDMVKTTLFVYGSLMNPEVLAALLEASSYRLLGEAVLIGYHRTGIKGVNYPAIHPAPDDTHVVKGMLLRLTTQKAIEIIDYFEDSVSEKPVRIHSLRMITITIISEIIIFIIIISIIILILLSRDILIISTLCLGVPPDRSELQDPTRPRGDRGKCRRSW